jgi:hypothetical protein
MGIIRNIALKTAIKKALLDVTKEIESLGKKIPQLSSFGEMVMVYAKHNPFVDKDLIEETWEGTFFGIVANRALRKMPSGYLIQNQSELDLLFSVITQWVASKGGNLTNIYSKF